jgi:hypothetical protein
VSLLDGLSTCTWHTNTASKQSIPFMVIISSLHIWLASDVLDINVMIMACYVYHFTGFQHTCSLRVLSLAMLGELREPEHHKEDTNGNLTLIFVNSSLPVCFATE